MWLLASLFLLASTAVRSVDGSSAFERYLNSTSVSTASQASSMTNLPSAPSFTTSSGSSGSIPNSASSAASITSPPYPTLPPYTNGTRSDCVVNVPKAGLLWWFNTSIHFADRTLSYQLTEINRTGYATGWTLLPSRTVNVTQLLTAKSTYSVTTIYDKAHNTSTLKGSYVPFTSPHAPITTSITERGYRTDIPTTTTFPRASQPFPGQFGGEFSTSLQPATTALGPPPDFTGTFSRPFLRFSQYEVESTKKAGLSVITVTSTYNLSHTQGYELAPYNFDGVMSASGQLPTAFQTAIQQSSCVLGTWKAVPTVIVVVILDLAAVAALAYQTAFSSTGRRPGPTFFGTAEKSIAPPVAPTIVPAAATASVICQGQGCTLFGGDPSNPASGGALIAPGTFVVPNLANLDTPTANNQIAPQTPFAASVGGAVTTPVPPQTAGPPAPSVIIPSDDPNLGENLSPLLSAIGYVANPAQVPLQPFIAPTPAPGSGQIVVGGEMYSSGANHAYTIDGQTLTPGGVITLPNGQVISLASNGQQINVNGHTSTVDGGVGLGPTVTSAPTSTTRGAGDFIMSGLGGAAPATSSTSTTNKGTGESAASVTKSATPLSLLLTGSFIVTLVSWSLIA